VETEILSGQQLLTMLESGLSCLKSQYRKVDLLNVFPVPDGDTGTNMYMTLSAAVEEAAAQGRGPIGNVAEAASTGALMGARGNSGVILSQLLRGLALGLKNMDRVSAAVFAQALDEGVKVAFSAVIKPVEGTILTVAKEAAKEAIRAANTGISPAEMMERVCQTAKDVLDHTPEMLPVLKEAGVVDAGGMGWLIILDGFRKAVCGEARFDIQAGGRGEIKDIGPAPVKGLQFSYCTEVLIDKVKSDEEDLAEDFRKGLGELGDSLLVVENHKHIRVHVHSDHPGSVLELCLKQGPLARVTVSNMNEQAEKVHREKKSAGEYGIVSVAFGQGLKDIMESLGADRVVTGGQTRNPSTQDILEAVEEIDAEQVIILPNNSNIMMTAKQVSSLSSKKVEIVPARTIPQGLAALLANMPGTGYEQAVRSMSTAAGNVKTGEVTFAVRNTKVNSFEVKKGDIIGIADEKIQEVGSSIDDVTTGLIRKMLSDDDEICSLYFGEDIKEQEAEALAAILEDILPGVEIELHYGGQPLYYYIISIE